MILLTQKTTTRRMQTAGAWIEEVCCDAVQKARRAVQALRVPTVRASGAANNLAARTTVPQASEVISLPVFQVRHDDERKRMN
jgi:hypothetical protein